ncbi:MAG: DUF4065 domain-containing protein [Chloroflexi bacterium]|nr:DUF4065 domain-containing protein [Chloroflexota bacterium]
MATVHDVAAYILEQSGPMSAMKLQKLVYYCQAWSLVWDDRPLFPEEIQAWANGPVVPELYKLHQGQFSLKEWKLGRPAALDQDAVDTINAVLAYYAPHNAQWLSDLTHAEDPWRKARKKSGLEPGERGQAVIGLDSMMEYYSTLSSRVDSSG